MSAPYGNARWTSDEEQWLMDNWDRYPLATLAQKLGRTTGSVRNKHDELKPGPVGYYDAHAVERAGRGVQPKPARSRWTEDELAALRSLRKHHSYRVIAASLGRSLNSVRNAAQRHLNEGARA